MKPNPYNSPIHLLLMATLISLGSACGGGGEGGAEATQSMPKIKGFYLGMSSDEADKNLNKLLDMKLQDQLDLQFTGDRLVSISFKLRSSSSKKLFNDGGISFSRFAEEFGKAYGLPLTFGIPDVNYSNSVLMPSYIEETTTYSYENRDVGYSIEISACDWIHPNGSRMSLQGPRLIYSSIKKTSGLNFGD